MHTGVLGACGPAGAVRRSAHPDPYISVLRKTLGGAGPAGQRAMGPVVEEGAPAVDVLIEDGLRKVRAAPALAWRLAAAACLPPPLAPPACLPPPPPPAAASLGAATGHQRIHLAGHRVWGAPNLQVQLLRGAAEA